MLSKEEPQAATVSAYLNSRGFKPSRRAGLHRVHTDMTLPWEALPNEPTSVPYLWEGYEAHLRIPVQKKKKKTLLQHKQPFVWHGSRMLASAGVVVGLMDGCLHQPWTLLTLVQYPVLPGSVSLREDFIFGKASVLLDRGRRASDPAQINYFSSPRVILPPTKLSSAA